jgi:tRNA pseudouridine55 synthase
MNLTDHSDKPMNFCGVLNVDKPAALTSRDVVNRVVPLVRPAKVGHAGTLDPLATGVLVVCVGHATRLIGLVQEGRKRYEGCFRLGQTSDTDDITGTVTSVSDCAHITREAIEALLPEFTGRILQTPPQYSAIHVQGRRAYDLARRGETVEIAARPVDVFSITLKRFERPDFELEVECGSGTYIRSIGRDLGLRLGCGALMTDLRRTSVGPFDVDDAVPLDQITADSVGQVLKPAINIVSHLPRQLLSESELTAIRQGKSVRSPFERLDSVDRRVAMAGPNEELVGIGEFDRETRTTHPRIVFPATM